MNAPPWWQETVEQINAYHAANPTNLPGCAFGVEAVPSGRHVGSVGEGWSNNTICGVGFMGKAFIATGVLLALEEHDRLDVDLLVWQLPSMDVFARGTTKNKIKIRHLLQQTAGLSNVKRYAEWPVTPCNCPQGPAPCCGGREPDVGPTVDWVGAPGITNECVFADGRCRPARRCTLEQVSRYVMETYPLCQEPGSGYVYSTANYVVAARIIEGLTGKSVNIFLKEKLFSPLGMGDSFFIAQPTGERELDAWMDEGVTEQQRGRIANITLLTPEGRMPPEMAPGPGGVWDKFRRRWRYVYPDSGMYSTAADLLTFLRMLRDGGVHGTRRILSPEIVRLLVEDQGSNHTMGFGFRRRTSPDLEAAHDVVPGASPAIPLEGGGGAVTRLVFLHRAMGSILPEHRDG